MSLRGRYENLRSESLSKRDRAFWAAYITPPAGIVEYESVAHNNTIGIVGGIAVLAVCAGTVVGCTLESLASTSEANAMLIAHPELAEPEPRLQEAELSTD